MTPNHQQAAETAETAYDPCPFCGHDPEPTHANDLSYYYVGCANEDCMVQPETELCPTEQEARTAWNWKPISPPAASPEQASDGPCLDCGEPCEVWFAPNELWNAVMPERAGLLCLRCFVKRANPLHINKGAWMLRTDPVFDNPPEQAAGVALPPIPEYRPDWDGDKAEFELTYRRDQLRTALAESQRLRQELAKDDDTQAEMAKRIAELETTKQEWALQINAQSEKEVRLLARIETLEDIDKACEEQRGWLIDQKNAAESRLRAVSEALDGYAEHRPLTSDEIALVAKLRAIVEGK